MDVLNEAKLQALADEVVDRAKKALAEDMAGLLDGLDGWTLTVTLHKPLK